METTIPKASAKANPRTLPVPNQYKIPLVIRDDTFESRMEFQARVKPISTAWE